MKGSGAIEPPLSPLSQSDIIFSTFFQISVPTLNICYNRKLLPIPKSQPSLKLAILLLLAGDVSPTPGPSTCSTDRVRLATINARSMKNKAASLADILESFDLEQHVNFPTHIHGHWLDLLITRTSCSAVRSVLACDGLSDHFLVLSELEFPRPKCVKKKIF